VKELYRSTERGRVRAELSSERDADAVDLPVSALLSARRGRREGEGRRGERARHRRGRGALQQAGSAMRRPPASNMALYIGAETRRQTSNVSREPRSGVRPWTGHRKLS
jgi:hypothetical protein